MTARRVILVVHPGAELFGSDRMALESVTGFIEAGARVVVALPTLGPLVDDLRAAGAEVVIVPMLVLRKALLRPSGWASLASDMLRGFRASWRLIGKVKPDAVYVSTITIPQWPLVARMRGVAPVSHVHEAEASGKRALNRALYLPHLVSRRVIVNSQFSLATIASVLPALARRSIVIHNGVESPEAPVPPRPSLGDVLRVLYVGRLSPRKGVDLVIKAASVLRTQGLHAEVTLLGAVFEGYEWYEAQLREQARAADVDVVFAGFHKEVWPFLAATDVLVVPSRADEPFGNTAVEGVLALRPVVASDTGGLREAAQGYSTAWLVAPDQPHSIADALVTVAEQWEQVVAGVSDGHAEAFRRHAPTSYRASVCAAVIGASGEPKRGDSRC